MADDSEIFEFSNRYNSAMDYPIVIKFGTEFDHWQLIITIFKVEGSKVKVTV